MSVARRAAMRAASAARAAASGLDERSMFFSVPGLVLSLAPTFVGAVHRIWRRRHPEVSFEGCHALAEQAQGGSELVVAGGVHAAPGPGSSGAASGAA